MPDNIRSLALSCLIESKRKGKIKGLIKQLNTGLKKQIKGNSAVENTAVRFTNSKSTVHLGRLAQSIFKYIINNLLKLTLKSEIANGDGRFHSVSFALAEFDRKFGDVAGFNTDHSHPIVVPEVRHRIRLLHPGIPDNRCE